MHIAAKSITTKQVRIFALILGLFATVLGGITWARGGALVVAGTILAIAWLASLAFSDLDRRAKALGILLPAIFLGIGLPIHLGAAALPLASAVWIIGGVIATLVFAVPTAGRAIHQGWTVAAIPIGWSISRAILAIVYYGVLTPIGLVMRLVGHDPMKRKPNPEADTFWTVHEQVKDPGRYFKQF